MKRVLSVVLFLGISTFLFALGMNDYDEPYSVPSVYGAAGNVRTLSAKTLGNGRMAIAISGIATPNAGQFGSDFLFLQNSAGDSLGVARIDNAFQMALRGLISVGFSDYFDLGVNVPYHIDNVPVLTIRPEWAKELERAKTSGIGDVEVWGKLQYPPYDHSHVFDMSFYGMISIPTGHAARGVVPKETYYIPNMTGTDFDTTFFTAKQITGRVLMLWTLDLAELEGSPLPLEFNLNYGIHTTARNYLDNAFLLNASFVLKPNNWLRFFADFSGVNRFGRFIDGFQFRKDPLYLSPGVTLATPQGFFLTAAYDLSLSDENLLDTLHINPDRDSTRMLYVLKPASDGFSFVAGWVGYLINPDRDDDGIPDKFDLCPDEPGLSEWSGCPDGDYDRDGVCDAWVEEQGLENELSHLCEGVDLCPNDPGDKKFFGCQNPDSDGDKICDPWVVDAGMSAKFGEYCSAIDQCPTIPGLPEWQGCPNPDSDRDGVCDAWVAEMGLQDQFAHICVGTDLCPEVKGMSEWKGCPNPDKDKDKVCDPWVADLDLLDEFSDVCSGVDRCPTTPGLPEKDGCDDPDTDKDGFCDPWVKKQGMSEQFASKCKGEDLCPNDPGVEEWSGCASPDKDKDGVCDAWVSEAGMSKHFSDVCKGVDACPADSGSVEWKGCPKSPDQDGDKICDPWVNELGLQDAFANICSGIDRCPELPGLLELQGCPNPDSDKDGICDPWVSEHGLHEKYAGVCKGVDKCPFEPETFNGYQDGDGCPDEIPKKPVVLKGVTFHTGKATLTDEAMDVLIPVVESLKDNPEAIIEIGGHTDSQGSRQINMKLSMERAQSVADYMRERGVKCEIRVIGYGPDQPIASNNTASGRRMNRRIEMKFLGSADGAVTPPPAAE